MRSKTISIISTSVGVLLVLSYWVLSLAGVVGQETDIGGGMILLAGYALVLGGIVALISNFWAARSRHKD